MYGIWVTNRNWQGHFAYNLLTICNWQTIQAIYHSIEHERLYRMVCLPFSSDAPIATYLQKSASLFLPKSYRFWYHRATVFWLIDVMEHFQSSFVRWFRKYVWNFLRCQRFPGKPEVLEHQILFIFSFLTLYGKFLQQPLQISSILTSPV
jgi:hypothetical protein